MVDDKELPSTLFDFFKEFDFRTINLENIKEIKIAHNASEESGRQKFFAGKILFKKKIDDFDYRVHEFHATLKDKKTFISHKLNFIIYPKHRLVVFGNREHGALGSRIISMMLFKNETKIKSLIFYPTKILQAKKKGLFSNVSFNGVYSSGHIRATNQFGTEIDNDGNFLNKPERYGIGVNATIDGENVMIRVFQNGSVVYLGGIKDFTNELKVRYSILKNFLPYSNYSKP